MTSVEVIKIGLNLRRKQLGMSVADVARKASVSKTVAHRWFDKAHDSTAKSLDTCAAAMNSHILHSIDEQRGVRTYRIIPNHQPQE